MAHKPKPNKPADPPTVEPDAALSAVPPAPASAEEERKKPARIDPFRFAGTPGWGEGGRFAVDAEGGRFAVDADGNRIPVTQE